MKKVLSVILAGAMVLYGVGRLLSVKQIEKLVSGRFGKLMHLKPTDIEKAARYFNNHGRTKTAKLFILDSWWFGLSPLGACLYGNWADNNGNSHYDVDGQAFKCTCAWGY